jgi:RNA polymerase sigma-70 factor (sigma-E family)
MDGSAREAGMADYFLPRAAPSRDEIEASGRDEAVDILFRTHGAALVRLAIVLLGDRADAEEVVQDAFVSLHRHWSGLRTHSSARAYLRAAVVNGCRSRQRRLVRIRTVTPRLVQLEPASVEEQALTLDEATRVAAAVQALPMRQREVVVARYYLGLTEAQTAEMLSISLGSVKRHAHRALAALSQGIGVSS